MVVVVVTGRRDSEDRHAERKWNTRIIVGAGSAGTDISCSKLFSTGFQVFEQNLVVGPTAVMNSGHPVFSTILFTIVFRKNENFKFWQHPP